MILNLLLIEIPPDSIYLSDAGPTHFTLTWNPHCTSDIGYRIAGSENCGTCVNITTNSSSIMCSSLSIKGQSMTCSLSIQAGLGSERVVARVILKSKIG
jgi:hypothetical protein